MVYFENTRGFRTNDEIDNKIKKLQDFFNAEDMSMLLRTLINRTWREITEKGVKL